MNKLPENFELNRYGLYIRLVKEEDAEFIVRLRSNDQLGCFLHKSNGNVEEQKLWINKYKQRELEQKEYYFIFFKDDIPFGLSRIYNVDWVHLSFTSGSWICEKDTPMQETLLTVVLTNEIVFDILGLQINLFDVRKGNKKVLKFHKNIMGAHQYAETDLDCLFMSTPDIVKQSKLYKYLGLK